MPSAADPRVGEVYLSADELASRIRELGAEISRDYEGREPLLVGLLKASLIFLTDLSRAIPIPHGLDFIELAGYGSAQMGGHEQIRVLKDLDADISGRDVILVEDVIDTGLTLNYLVRTFELRKPRSVDGRDAARPALSQARRRSARAVRRLRRARTSSSSASGSTSRRSGATCPICTSSGSRFRLG